MRNSIWLWDVSDPGHPVLTTSLTGHTITARWAAFSPDGRTLVSASADNAMMMWDIADPTTAVRFATFKSADLQSQAVALSPDGRTLACRRLLRRPRPDPHALGRRGAEGTRRRPRRARLRDQRPRAHAAEWKRYIPELTATSPPADTT